MGFKDNFVRKAADEGGKLIRSIDDNLQKINTNFGEVVDIFAKVGEQLDTMSKRLDAIEDKLGGNSDEDKKPAEE